MRIYCDILFILCRILYGSSFYIVRLSEINKIKVLAILVCIDGKKCDRYITFNVFLKPLCNVRYILGDPDVFFFLYYTST